MPVIAGGFGAALVLSAVGAILRYALGWEPASVDVGIVALILMIVDAAMIFRTLLLVFSARQRPRSMPPPRY